ncbi:pseudouridine synthase [Synechococcus sp. A15-24]|uniref:pseudouridine synthase n=1 Tax=Synechococcus sp. A15-24 TaxID=1050635 RepID=UPI001862ED7C|nr:pseudouridine synthase [Synechococcus sp. A15-24]QNJ28447.1 23S rRNA pseudouridine2457 synthase [Synechococcus sp. A15-24]
MTTLLFNKPYGVLSQFTPEVASRWRCLAEFINVPGVYAAGRLDADSEGLLLLTDQGRLQQRLTDPRFGHWRSYWVQVEGHPDDDQLQRLREGVEIQRQRTLPARAHCLQGKEIPLLPERDPPIRVRATIPTSWLELSLREGRNRQVRRMTAAVGLPTLRLIRCRIDLMDGGDAFDLNDLPAGRWRSVTSAEQERLNRLLSSRAPRPHRTSREADRRG